MRVPLSAGGGHPHNHTTLKGFLWDQLQAGDGTGALEMHSEESHKKVRKG